MPVAANIPLILPIARAVTNRARRVMMRDTRVRFGALRPSTDLSIALKAACLACYNFEADGTDSSPNGKNLTITGTPTFTAGKIGNAWTGNGSKWYGSTAAALITSGSFWLSGWFSWTGTTYAAMMSQQDDGAGSNGTFTLDNTFGTGTTFRFSTMNTISGFSVVSWSSTSNDGVLHFVNCWFDGVNININVDNGTTVSTAASGTMRYDATPFRVGSGDITTGTTGINGKIDILHVFNRAPAAGEIAYLWNSGAARQLY